jgi:hypothetical protein
VAKLKVNARRPFSKKILCDVQCSLNCKLTIRISNYARLGLGFRVRIRVRVRVGNFLGPLTKKPIISISFTCEGELCSSHGGLDDDPKV